MNGIGKRLKRLEGPSTLNGEVPAWCVECAGVEARLDFITPGEVQDRAEMISRQYRSKGAYLDHQQQRFHDFIEAGCVA